MKLKERYKKFREWQRQPFHYVDEADGTIHHCANCDKEFTGKFCPRCGQKALVGRINWQTVREGVMLLWGMDNRSMGYSLLQLFLRPGYMISDYISGRRQVSFPPVKMLFIETVVCAHGFDHHSHVAHIPPCTPS